jgi:glycosyltransferase involved in cell wall biosynthesis
VTDADLTGVRIAIANWRDPWHPQAGGAERYAWMMARGLVSRGARVTFLTARAPGQSRRDSRDGIAIVRLGGRFTVYPLVLAAVLTHRRSYDAVIDCQNGLPFLTPLVLPAHTPAVLVVHHVHTEQFGVHFPAWAAWLGRFLEGPVSRAVYRRCQAVAVSPSTIAAMRERLHWTGPIELIPNGCSPAADSGSTDSGSTDSGSTGSGGTDSGPASKAGTSLVWVGRLVRHKRAALLLDVAERLGVPIDVVGRGPESASLAAAVEARGLGGLVRLRGFLSEAEKQAVVAGSLLHLNTSSGEGWGLCVLEAAAAGVPTVAFDVEGLRDAVLDGRTGWLVRDGAVLADVVEQALKELSDPARRAEVAAACRAWAARFDWDRSAAQLAALLS